MSESISELLRFVQIGARLDLKAVALENILGLTGSEPGILAIAASPPLLFSLIALLNDTSVPVAKDAALALVNLSAHQKAAEILANLADDTTYTPPPLQSAPEQLVASILRFIFDENSKISDPCCMILSNLTRPAHLCEKIADQIVDSGHGFDKIINIFTKKAYNKAGAQLHYLGPVLSNLSQSRRVRRFILDREKCVIQRLLPFTEYEGSLVRRGGIVGTLKNCCFEQEFHEWMLGEEVNILPRLLLPLAGNEEFDDEDNDKLPMDLQYLPADKQREPDPDIRCILLEALIQLCSIRKNREFIREQNSYVILRELHKWEKDKKAMLLLEDLVNVLIRTEEEIGQEDLKSVEVPLEMQDRFIKEDEEFVKLKE